MSQHQHTQPQQPQQPKPEAPNPEPEDVEILDEDALTDQPQAEAQAEVEFEQKQVDEADAKIKELEEGLAKEKKEYLFLMAEFDNFRKRTVKEKADIIRNAAETAMKGLLPIVDDFERALQAEKDEGARQGMELIYQKLMRYLASNGVKPMESTGTDFDPDLHEAIAMVPVTDEAQKGKVIDTPTKGYTINDKVLRHPKVAVGQ